MMHSLTNAAKASPHSLLFRKKQCSMRASSYYKAVKEGNKSQEYREVNKADSRWAWPDLVGVETELRLEWLAGDS